MIRAVRNLCPVAAAAIILSGCTALSTDTTPATITRAPSPATLQLAVGTENNAFGLLGTPGTFLNIMATFRNASGLSAFPNPGVATLTGPGGLDIGLGDLYVYGLEPGDNGTLGEPPAFSPQNNDGGYSTGYILTGEPDTPGTYSVSTTPPVQGHKTTYTATATLPNAPTVLPDEPLPTWVTDGKGGGTFTMTNPAGVTESLIFIQAFSGQYVADVELKSPATSVNVPDGTLAAGTTYYVFCIGADFPLIESAAPNSKAPAPTITSSGGTADITASFYTTFTE